MMPQSRKNGLWGEIAASRALRDRGYEIKDANFRTRMGEVDLIAQKGNTLVFCEVKTRTGQGETLPREAVDLHKQKRLVAAALQYVKMRKFRGPIRFDVIEVYLLPEQKPLVNILENAFQTDAEFGFGL